ncbi:hypothetical protein ACMHYB_15105 [Sorangium sp. So ce1128]
MHIQAGSFASRRAAIGVRSENAAHRFAVEWGSANENERREGVYIPRRHTSSWMNRAAGGRLFPGVHRGATFHVSEQGDHFSVAMASDDGLSCVSVEARVARAVPKASVFASLEEATSFFEAGSVGLSDARRPGEYDALRLRCPTFRLTPLDVERVSSSFFDDRSLFPEGSVRYDSAFLMRGVEHEWRGLPSVCAAA